MKQWVEILQTLSLTEAEREVVKRFAADPEGRMFLPMADILRGHEKRDEAIELLIQGVSRHPRYSVARVVLARELFHKGMVQQSLDYLQTSLVNLSDNLLAQHLIFKLCVALEDEVNARAALQNIRNHNLIDPEINELGRLMVVEGIIAVKEVIAREAIKRGFPLQISRVNRIEEEPLKAKPLQESSVNYKGIENFHVLSLSDVFAQDRGYAAEEYTPSGGLELDSTTLAEIYESQHHYSKALGIYRRLLRISPRNDHLRRKVSELARKSADQKNDDLVLDPLLVDQMEETRTIDKRIDYLQNLLDNIDTK